MADGTPYLPFYGTDFYDDERVSLLPLAAQALYIALLWRQWREGSIPDNAEQIAILVRAKGASREIAALWEQYVSNFFKPIAHGRAANPTLELVRERHLSVSKSRTKSRQNSNNDPTTSSTPPDIDIVLQVDQKSEFEKIWSDLLIHRIPEPIGKKAAWAHFKSSVRTPEDVAAIALALTNYRATERVWRGFIQHAATWFNNWRDYVSVAPKRAETTPRRDIVFEQARALKALEGDPAVAEYLDFIAPKSEKNGARLLRDGDDLPTFDEWKAQKKGAEEER